MDLVVAQVGKDRGENRRLGDVLTGMGRVPVLAGFRVAELFRGALVSATASAEDAIGNVVSAVVTAHGR
jgi:H+/gluconate symporter-like permease